MKRYMSLSRLVRLFIGLFAVMLIVTLSIYVLNYYVRSKEESRRYVEQALEESARLMVDQIEDTVLVMQSIALNGGGSEFCTSGHTWRNENQDYLRTQLSQLALDSTLFREVILFSHDRVYCAGDNREEENPYVLYDALYEELSLEVPFRKPQYSMLSSTAIRSMTSETVVPVVNIVVPVWAQNSRSQLESYCGVCIVQIKIANLLNQVNVTGRPLILAFENGQVASSENYSILSMSHHEDAELLGYELKDYGWTLYVEAEERYLSMDMRRIIQFTIAAGLLMMVVHTAFVLLFRYMVVRPIQSLADVVSQSTTSVVALDEDVSHRNELVMLATAFNDMLERIRRDNEEEMRRLRERAVFMQARINPHFLYNNLECIRGMAALKCFDDIRALTSVMADIYRYCNHSNPIVTLQEELSCAQNYVELISLRYPNRLTLEIRATDDSRACSVPRMCLQPLLENSIYHGILADCREKGSIQIQCWTNPQGLYIIIDDDGCGMTEEEFARVNSSDQSDENAVKHLGVSNVRNRLLMLFGSEGNLKFMPLESGGTRAVMYVPFEQKLQDLFKKHQE